MARVDGDDHVGPNDADGGGVAAVGDDGRAVLEVGGADGASEPLDLDGGAGVLSGEGWYVAVTAAGGAVNGHHGRAVCRRRSAAGLARLPGGWSAPDVVVGYSTIAPVALA